MSDTDENIEMPVPCVLVTSCDSGFKEEELIKREFSVASIYELAKS